MRKILLVEDEPDVSQSLVRLLEKRGYMITPALNGRDAVRFLKEERFDLAIVDLILPDIHGQDLCAIIRHDTKIKTMPIIISTAVGLEFNETMCKDLGVNEFLIKPYRPQELLSAIERCLKK
jgi:DNA-binding response OmpR family regulator